MKDSRAEKSEVELRALESALRARLKELLPTALEANSTLFMSSQFNPFDLPAHHLSQGEELARLAQECVRLRDKVSFLNEGSVGQLYLAACSEGASSDQHRRGPRRLAELLLRAIENGA